MQAKKLYRGTPATGAPATVYTVAAGTDGVTAGSGGAIVRSVVVSNVTATDAVVAINMGGVALAVGQVVKANSELIIESGMLDVLAIGDTIQVGQTTANACTLRVMAVTF